MDCNDMIDDWYAVDDGSNAEELAEMKAIAANIKWLEKPADQSGHVGSINALMQVAAGYDYFVWMEDDWLFVRDEYMVSKALKVFGAEPNVAQVRPHS
jgi:GT2 family glycosyltransferase